MKLIALRHGQSEYNVLGLCNDDPARGVALTRLGLRQARQAAERLRGEGIAHVYCSPLLRARQTAETVAAQIGAALTIDARLGDIRSGFDGRPVADYLAFIADDPLHTRPPGGESLLDFQRRISGFLDGLRTAPYSAVALVAHEETLRIIKAHAEGLPLAAVVGLAFANAQPYGFELTW